MNIIHARKSLGNPNKQKLVGMSPRKLQYSIFRTCKIRRRKKFHYSEPISTQLISNIEISNSLQRVTRRKKLFHNKAADYKERKYPVRTLIRSNGGIRLIYIYSMEYKTTSCVSTCRL